MVFRMLIADDEELVRRGLTALIEREAPEIDVVETAVDGLEALELSERCRPDILLTDIRMPGLSGLDLIGRLKAAGPAPRCIVLSGYDDFEYARRAIGLDVAEYLLKPVDPDQLLGALARVRAGIEVTRREEQTRATALQALQALHLQRLLSGAPAAPSAEWLPTAPAWGLLLARCRDGTATGVRIERFRTLAREVTEGALLAEDGPDTCTVLCPLQCPDPEGFAALARSLHARLEDAGLPIALIAARPCTALARLAGAYAEATAAATCARHDAGDPLLCWEATPERPEPASRGTIPELRAYIEAHVGEDLSIAALGRRMHLSAKYLGELFKEATGEPLGEYIIRTRMRHACALLASTSLKVYAVAGQVGYADAKHFATMFRAVIGISPAEYRAAHRGGPLAPPQGGTPCPP